ncbi:extracellular solute-binding protein, family 3 [Thermotoga petrophila RKU-1]|uniref:Extracellular solute-binding protein, family 3 n=1 Tax=Thermotoga petrophila (strain ATCC BAA-488 / DSM 13995 / JCM 10881 / RKU-1) TaxID=390874 RepID=A5IJI0_THEP1|nr:basic amino acid ABC transporter substrate-binding protein [Thermotoga petrophila]ABQ46353.1 extracellular solute-binding protein, family 3 [Thermotoga petrophila RKU-1]
MKKLLVVLVLLVSIVIFSGTIDEIKSRGYLLVGLSADFPPFEFVDENGNIAGFDVDLAKEIARRLGVELKIVDMTFDGLIPSLLTKKIDVIISGMTITEERKKVVAFSDPYFDAGQVIVVRKDSDFRPKTYEDLVGKTVAVQIGTTGDIEVSKYEGIKVVRFDKFTDAFLELKRGRADAVVLDSATARAFVAKNPDLVISSGVLSSEQYGIAVRKEDTDLLEFINSVLRELKKSPYDVLIEKWFSE